MSTDNKHTEAKTLPAPSVGVGDLLAELQRLRSFMHARAMHPDYEYTSTDGPRKAFDEHAPEGERWERNTDMGRNGWERFDYHEEAYWRRRKDSSANVKDEPRR